MQKTKPDQAVADDILRSAKAISEFIFGDDREENRKRIYHLAAIKQLPTFRLGQILCARKSTLVAHFAAQEAQSTQGGADKTEAA
jgi:hypothetical protein